MERPELRVVGPLGRSRRPASRGALWVAALAGVCALWATLSGADRERRVAEMHRVAEPLLLVILEAGPHDPEVRRGLRKLRYEMFRRPLDARSCAVYAGLLMEAASRPNESLAARFYASRAAELAPVTVPVVRGAVQVLVRAADHSRAGELIRSMFFYEPASAARLLALVGPLLPDEATTLGGPGAAVPEEPRAWLAWSLELERGGRVAEAEAVMRRTTERWPRYLGARRELASRAVGRSDWETLARVVPLREALAAEPQAASLFAFRARLAAETGALEQARQDAAQAVELARAHPTVLALAGDALLAAGDTRDARGLWVQALYSADLPQTLRPTLLLRLARWEDAHGKPADALRAWRAVLEHTPAHGEARRRADELSGFRR